MSKTVTQAQVDSVIAKSHVVFEKFGKKTLVCYAELPNGFVLVTDASCVDPSNFDFEIGKEICLDRLSNKIWELEAYVLSSKS